MTYQRFTTKAFHSIPAMSLALTASMAAAQTAPPVPNLLQQFQQINGHGEALGFRRNVAQDASTCRHYQSVQRRPGGGTPIFYLTRSGAWTISCSNTGNQPGEIVVARILSAIADDGERIGSNKLQHDTDTDDTEPPASDYCITSYVLDGEGRRPGWSHPGGTQWIDGFLIVPVEKPYGDNASTSPGGLLVIDFTLIGTPQIHKEFTFDKEVGVVGVTKSPDTGKYLFLLTGAQFTDDNPDFDPGDTIEFWESSSDDLSDPDLTLTYLSTWRSDLADGTTNNKWRDFQMVNCIRDAEYNNPILETDQFYILCTDNDTATLDSGKDLARLFRVDRYGDTFSVHYQAERRLKLNQPEMGDLDAAGGTYVSPSGQLMLYTIAHDNDGAGGSLQLGEFRNWDVNSAGTTDGNGWVCLYADKTGWSDSNPGRSFILDYLREYDEDWDQLTLHDDFNDDAESVRWCIPPNRCARLYEHELYGGRSLTLAGTGQVMSLSDLDFLDWGVSAVAILEDVFVGPQVFYISSGTVSDCSYPGEGTFACPFWGFYSLGTALSQICGTQTTIYMYNGSYVDNPTIAVPVTLDVIGGGVATIGE